MNAGAVAESSELRIGHASAARGSVTVLGLATARVLHLGKVIQRIIGENRLISIRIGRLREIAVAIKGKRP
jgi:hypothetical protein